MRLDRSFTLSQCVSSLRDDCRLRIPLLTLLGCWTDVREGKRPAVSDWTRSEPLKRQTTKPVGMYIVLQPGVFRSVPPGNLGQPK